MADFTSVSSIERRTDEPIASLEKQREHLAQLKVNPVLNAREIKRASNALHFWEIETANDVIQNVKRFIDAI